MFWVFLTNYSRLNFAVLGKYCLAMCFRYLFEAGIKQLKNLFSTYSHSDFALNSFLPVELGRKIFNTGERRERRKDNANTDRARG